MGLRAYVFALAMSVVGCGAILGISSDDDDDPSGPATTSNDASSGGEGDTTIDLGIDAGSSGGVDAAKDATTDATKDADASDGGATNPNACNGKPSCERLVFVTSATYPGNFGATTANDKCRAAADASALPNVRGRLWRAWISTATKSASQNIVMATVPYRRIDGEPIADDYLDLVDGSLAHAINQDESGNALTTSGSVWTATGANGAYIASGCNGFTSASQGSAKVGNASALDGAWSDSGDFTCGMTARLYCFEY